MCEAIESDCAERAPADGPFCSFDELPFAERAPQLADYSRNGASSASIRDPVQWCRAEEAWSGRPFHLPHDLVSLDLTAPATHGFDRSSAGLGLGPTVDAAMTVSLLELIERDAVGEWQRRAVADRLAERLQLDSIDYGWLREWRERFAALDIDLVVFTAKASVPVPVIVCWIGGQEEFGDRYRSFSGSACHPDPERALFKALAEAIQSRLTFIAGVRDDILPSHYRAPPPPPWPAVEERGCRDWAEVDPGPPGWQALAELLADAGYAQIAVKRLDEGMDGLAVTKMFVPGLGSLKRPRRRVP